MNSRHFEQISSRALDLLRRVLVAAVLLALLSLGAFAPRAAQASPDEHANLLMQFTAGGHVLGFQRDAVYIASADHALRIEFVGGADVAPVAETPASSAGRALALSKVRYPNMWDGISVSYEATAGGIAKSSYLLDAGASVEQIRLRYNVPIELDASGDLIARLETGEMRERAPIAWQEIDGSRIPIQVAFRLIDSSIENQKSKIENALVGFALGEYNRAYPLVIDPTLEWNTFLGGSGNDGGGSIAIDGSGNVYVSGISSATWGASPVQAYTSGYDAFAAKLDSSGALHWNTFLGGSGYDSGQGIAVDTSGNVYVVGYSDADWGTNPVRAYSFGDDAFAAKLDSNGVLQWHTFLGGSTADFGYGIAVDGSGNVYVAGTSDATWQGSVPPVRGYTANSDAFAAKLDSSGALQWNTFLGGLWQDYGKGGIAVDTSGNVYVTGYSTSDWGSPKRGYNAGNDGFAAKLDSSGALQWNTFLGGSGTDDEGTAIAVDGNGNVYVAGFSNADWGAGFLRAYTGAYDGFIAKLNSSGDLQWRTFQGGSADDVSFAIAVDGSGNLYVAGYSEATWGNPTRGFNAVQDAFAAKLNSSGGLQWNTFLGGSQADVGLGITLDASGNVYVGGRSMDTWGNPKRNFTVSAQDAFVARLSTGTTTTVSSSANPSIVGQSITFTATVSENDPLAPTGTVTFKDGATTLGTGGVNGSGQATFTTSALSTGSHSITAEYGGDANFGATTSSALNQVVQSELYLPLVLK